MIFLQYGVEKLLAWLGFRSTIGGPSFKSGGFDLSAMAEKYLVLFRGSRIAVD